MESRHILDTNIVIYYLDGALKPTGKVAVDRGVVGGAKMSVISKIELLCWNPPHVAGLQKVRSFVNEAIILPLDDAIIETTIDLRKNHHKIKLPDAIIAATALCFNAVLITRNVSDFSSIKELKLLDPFNV